MSKELPIMLQTESEYSSFLGMTVSDYKYHKKQELEGATKRSFERAQSAKKQISEQNHKKWDEFTAKELAYIARIECFKETSIGVDMQLWCEEMFRRIRNKLLRSTQNGLENVDITVMIDSMIKYNSKEFHSLFEKNQVQECKLGQSME